MKAANHGVVPARYCAPDTPLFPSPRPANPPLKRNAVFMCPFGPSRRTRRPAWPHQHRLLSWRYAWTLRPVTLPADARSAPGLRSGVAPSEVTPLKEETPFLITRRPLRDLRPKNPSPFRGEG